MHTRRRRSDVITVSVVVSAVQNLQQRTVCGAWSVEDKLYIVMELVEGATLAEHFASLKEKRQKFSESRIWNIFVQVSQTAFTVTDPFFYTI